MAFNSPRVRVIAVGNYEGSLRAEVAQWKYRGLAIRTGRLADSVVRAVDQVLHRSEIDVVTWAPTSRRRERDRGYDQAELLARAVARRLHLPCRRLLIRRNGEAQTGRGRAERIRSGPHFVARPPKGLLRVLVIDDVVTTGSTLESARSALINAGYHDVVLAALARTPRTESS